MSEEKYEPVSCDYHDELEAAAMHKKQVNLEFDLAGVVQRSKGTVQDVYTADGAEWIRFAPEGEQSPLEIRLDHIVAME